MTNQIRNPNDQTDFIRFASIFALSTAASAACWWAAGQTLGLFFGGLFTATFLSPAGVLAQKTVGRSVVGLSAVIAPVAFFWLLAVLKGADPFSQWAATVLVLIAYGMAIGGVALVLERTHCPPVFAAAMGIVIGLAWLTWPIWLSSTLVQTRHDAVAQSLVRFSPALTINGVLTSEPAWTEHSIAYQLTNLNQDIPTTLPRAPWRCAGLHTFASLLLWTTAFIRRLRQRQPDVLNSAQPPLQ